jgi:hypothetical protein
MRREEMLSSTLFSTTPLKVVDPSPAWGKDGALILIVCVTWIGRPVFSLMYPLGEEGQTQDLGTNASKRDNSELKLISPSFMLKTYIVLNMLTPANQTISSSRKEEGHVSMLIWDS